MSVDGAEGARFSASFDRKAALPLPGEDLNYPAHRVGPIDDAARSTQHLDPLDIVSREIGPVEGAAGLVGGHAINEHLHIVALATPQEHGGDTSE